MKEFTNLDDLFNHIEESVNNTLQHEDILLKIELDIRNYIIENMYNKTPKEYNRTNEFINSLTVDTELDEDGAVQIKVFFDTNKITSSFDPNSFWNQHMSMFGNDVSDLIPLWIEEGVSNPKSYYQRQPLGALSSYKRYNENTFKLKFEQTLKKIL